MLVMGKMIRIGKGDQEETDLLDELVCPNST